MLRLLDVLIDGLWRPPDTKHGQGAGGSNARAGRSSKSARQRESGEFADRLRSLAPAQSGRGGSSAGTGHGRSHTHDLSNPFRIASNGHSHMQHRLKPGGLRKRHLWRISAGLRGLRKRNEFPRWRLRYMGGYKRHHRRARAASGSGSSGRWKSNAQMKSRSIAIAVSAGLPGAISASIAASGLTARMASAKSISSGSVSLNRPNVSFPRRRASLTVCSRDRPAAGRDQGCPTAVRPARQPQSPRAAALMTRFTSAGRPDCAVLPDAASAGWAAAHDLQIQIVLHGLQRPAAAPSSTAPGRPGRHGTPPPCPTVRCAAVMTPPTSSGSTIRRFMSKSRLSRTGPQSPRPDPASFSHWSRRSVSATRASWVSYVRSRYSRTHARHSTHGSSYRPSRRNPALANTGFPGSVATVGAGG